MGYNRNFDLTLDDMELIESALRQKQKALNEVTVTADSEAAEAEERLRKTHELLGRLHNQKTFYRPKTGAYVGG